VASSPAIDELLLGRLGAVAEATGSELFYPRLASFLANALRCKRWLVVRYSQYGAPEFIVNSAMTDSAVRLYLDGLYRLDPLLRLVQSGTRQGWFILRQIDDPEVSTTYFDRLFQIAMIYDEAAVLLSTPGGSSIAVCVERAAEKFSVRNMDLVRSLYPMLKSLHQVHLDRTFAVPSHGRFGRVNRPKQAILILDNRNVPVFHNEGWSRLEREGKTPDMRTICAMGGAGMKPLGYGLVFHWEELPESFAVAPRGRFCTIEPLSRGYLTIGVEEALARFQEHYDLTPRERDIIDLVLQGYPNSKIAAKLQITSGTVRNHRYRLYYKLDITTERELFYMFIDLLLQRNAGERGDGAIASFDSPVLEDRGQHGEPAVNVEEISARKIGRI
jgi:DNA-binding CsgD family transcriptional regulator